MKVRPGRSRTCRQQRLAPRELLHAVTSCCRPALRRGVRRSRADRYVKCYGSVDFALALASLFVLGIDSLRQLKEQLDLDQRLARRVRLAGISHAQLPKLLHARPPALWGPLLAQLLRRLSRQQAPSRLRVLDSTFFVASAKLLGRYCQQVFDPATAGIKLALSLDPVTWVPEDWRFQLGQGSDAGLGPQLLPARGSLAGLTYVFDRGFRNYGFYQQLLDRGAHFLTRGSSLIHYQVQAPRPLDPARPQIVADQRVRLGAPGSRNRLRADVRRIVLQTEQEQLVFLSSDFELTAWELCQLYRQRWAIEVFFRWLKRVIGCLRPLGHSPQAAQHTVCAALVAYLLVLLLSGQPLGSEESPSLPQLKSARRRLAVLLYQPPQPAQLAALGFT